MTAILNLKNYLIAAILVLFGTLIIATLAVPQGVGAQSNYTPKKDLCGGADLKLDQASCDKDGSPSKNINDLIATIVNVISILVGVVAVIMIIWGGFKFVTSGGDSNQVASARQTIIYAIVGLLIVAFSQVIVRFILNRVA